MNSYAVFFSGWVSSPSGYATFQNASAASTPVVYTNTGATTVTAQYSSSTISQSTTLNSGIYNIAGNLTVPAGVTLTLNSGATLNFPSGTGLTVNGTLVSNAATLTSPNNSSWNGITLNSAEGSSIQNTTISYASSPIIINTTNNISIIGCTINNSSFYGGDGNSAAAIQVWSSSPTINSTVIEGQSNSWNGVRFGNSSTGSLNNCTIENLGDGNGVIIQGGSSPTIFDNTIQNNYFHGITIYYNGTASPYIHLNTISNNTISNYVGIYFQNSVGLVIGNDISGFADGIWCRYSSSPNSGGLGQEGNNLITNNTEGLVATDNSYPAFGSGLAAKNEYYGVCNQIYGNISYDAVSETGSNIGVEYAWWGQYPPNTSQMYTDGTSYIDAAYPETSSSACPLNSGAAPVYQASTFSTNSSSNDSLSSLMHQAMVDKFIKDYAGAASLCRRLLKYDVYGVYGKQALVILFNIFQSTGDSTIVNDLINYSLIKNNLGITAKELLASAYSSEGRLSGAEVIANNLIASYPNSNAEIHALLTLASLSGFSHKYNAVSSSAINVLNQKYSSSIDSGLVVALCGFENNSAGNSAKLSKQALKNTNTGKLSFKLDNYPNPFNPSTIIRYEIPQDGLATLKIYDEIGRLVKTLVNQYQSKGRYNINFNASQLASGIYFYRLSEGNFISTKKMILLK